MKDVIVEFLLTTSTIKKVIKEELKRLKELQDKKEPRNVAEVAEFKELKAKALKKFLDKHAPNAKSITITTHPAKFSHPEAKIDHFIAEKPPAKDGLLRTGNHTSTLDAIRSNAFSATADFLLLKLPDGLTVFEHLQEDTSHIKSEFNIPRNDYADIREQFLKSTKSADFCPTHSDNLIKQVFFPVANGDNYHLLSLLTPSGLLTQFKSEINKINKNPEPNQPKQKIPNLTEIHFGGSNPGNISHLNKNSNVFQLLRCMPPQLEKRPIQPPKTDFFKETLWFDSSFKELFKQLNQTAVSKTAVSKAQHRRDRTLKYILEHIQHFAQSIREKIKPAWSRSATYQKLPRWQKIYLDDHYKNIRKDNTKNKNYQDKCIRESARWITKSYSEHCKNNLGDVEFKEIQKILQKAQDSSPIIQ